MAAHDDERGLLGRDGTERNPASEGSGAEGSLSFTRRLLLGVSWTLPLVASSAAAAFAQGGNPSAHADNVTPKHTDTVHADGPHWDLRNHHDANHGDGFHQDSNTHYDSNHTDSTHQDYTLPHGDYAHGDVNKPSHLDTKHGDFSHHQDGSNHADQKHADHANHFDTPHTDWAHIDRTLHQDKPIPVHGDAVVVGDLPPVGN